MKRFVANIAVAALFAASIAAPVAAQASPNHNNINARYRNQEHRIYSGVRHDQLSPREYANLQGREVRLRQREAIDRRHDDGHLTAIQHRNLERMANRDSRAIYREKHDGPGR